MASQDNICATLNARSRPRACRLYRPTPGKLACRKNERSGQGDINAQRNQSQNAPAHITNYPRFSTRSKFKNATASKLRNPFFYFFQLELVSERRHSRSPNAEIRNPKEIRSSNRTRTAHFSDFGIRISFGFRIADFGFRRQMSFATESNLIQCASQSSPAI